MSPTTSSPLSRVILRVWNGRVPWVAEFSCREPSGPDYNQRCYPSLWFGHISTRQGDLQTCALSTIPPSVGSGPLRSPFPPVGNFRAAKARPFPGRGRSSSPGEFHPEALTEPCVNLSIHTALHSRSLLSVESNPSREERAHPGNPVDRTLRRAMSSSSLHVHYRRFNATTG
jgi:hypothetical protein